MYADDAMCCRGEWSSSQTNSEYDIRSVPYCRCWLLSACSPEYDIRQEYNEMECDNTIRVCPTVALTALS